MIWFGNVGRGAENVPDKPPKTALRPSPTCTFRPFSSQATVDSLDHLRFGSHLNLATSTCQRTCEAPKYPLSSSKPLVGHRQWNGVKIGSTLRNCDFGPACELQEGDCSRKYDRPKSLLSCGECALVRHRDHRRGCKAAISLHPIHDSVVASRWHDVSPENGPFDGEQRNEPLKFGYFDVQPSQWGAPRSV